MTNPKDRRSRLADLCASLHDDDGINPREEKLADRNENRRKPSSKDQQLAMQVRLALEHAMRGRIGDRLLQSVTIASVEPAPDATRFAVILSPAPGGGPLDEPRVLNHLQALRGGLRSAIAEAITRKRTPDLTFAILPTGGGEERRDDR